MYILMYIFYGLVGLVLVLFFFTFGVRVCTHDRGGGPSYSPMVVFPPPYPNLSLPSPRPSSLPLPRSESFQVMLLPCVVSDTLGATALRMSGFIDLPLSEPGVVTVGVSWISSSQFSKEY